LVWCIAQRRRSSPVGQGNRRQAPEVKSVVRRGRDLASAVAAAAVASKAATAAVRVVANTMRTVIALPTGRR